MNVRSTVTPHRQDTRKVSNDISHVTLLYGCAFVLSVFTGGMRYVFY